MQTSPLLPSAQLPLFQEAFWASNGAPLLDDVIDSPFQCLHRGTRL